MASMGIVVVQHHLSLGYQNRLHLKKFLVEPYQSSQLTISIFLCVCVCMFSGLKIRLDIRTLTHLNEKSFGFVPAYKVLERIGLVPGLIILIFHLILKYIQSSMFNV
jgi:hypothetical protein